MNGWTRRGKERSDKGGRGLMKKRARRMMKRGAGCCLWHVTRISSRRNHHVWKGHYLSSGLLSEKTWILYVFMLWLALQGIQNWKIYPAPFPMGHLYNKTDIAILRHNMGFTCNRDKKNGVHSHQKSMYLPQNKHFKKSHTDPVNTSQKWRQLNTELTRYMTF